jgi:ribosomal protein S27E
MEDDKAGFTITCNKCGNTAQHQTEEPFNYHVDIAICLTSKDEIVIRCAKCGNTIISL